MITAEKVYREILEMPLKERGKLFAVIARRGFEKDLYKHNEVFDEIRRSPFTVKEAAEYLEVAEITLRRWIKAGRIKFRSVHLLEPSQGRYDLIPFHQHFPP